MSEQPRAGVRGPIPAPSRLVAFLTRLVSSIDSHDFLGVTGAGLITGGLWQLHPPTALIVLGVICLAAAVVGAKNAGRP